MSCTISPKAGHGCGSGGACACGSASADIDMEGATEGASLGVDAARRSFLKTGAAFATVALSSTVTLIAFGGEASAQVAGPQKALDPKARWGMLIDAAKCGDGCNACVTACKTEHGWGDTGHPDTDAQWIRKVSLVDPKTGAKRELPVMCQHCAEPPCADVCPTGASFKRADGIVLVDKHLCIGCRYCMMACPYKARSFVHEPLTGQKPNAPRGKGTVESCNLCVDRVDSGRIPACVEACDASGGGAMLFGNLNDPASEISKRVASLATMQIRADLNLDPGIRYTPI